MAQDHKTENTDTGPAHAGPVSPLKAGLAGRCPRCFRGKVLHKGLELRPACPACGLDLRQVDPGDGPAVFVILILGALTAVLAFIIGGLVRPPMWVHMILWPLFIAGAGFWMLRVVKVILVALELRHDAHEGRIDPAGDADDPAPDDQSR
ncbi:DUF983 domain-containing protein [Yunchengibacter salinarum]|uniref:DUF983 domain-containing protein n=1 Tax=Yunchengibacter salinarum TaxID=3133399 RepID=UPI0035B5E828